MFTKPMNTWGIGAVLLLAQMPACDSDDGQNYTSALAGGKADGDGQADTFDHTMAVAECIDKFSAAEPSLELPDPLGTYVDCLVDANTTVIQALSDVRQEEINVERWRDFVRHAGARVAETLDGPLECDDDDFRCEVRNAQLKESLELEVWADAELGLASIIGAYADNITENVPFERDPSNFPECDEDREQMEEASINPDIDLERIGWNYAVCIHNVAGEAFTAGNENTGLINSYASVGNNLAGMCQSLGQLEGHPLWSCVVDSMEANARIFSRHFDTYGPRHGAR